MKKLLFAISSISLLCNAEVNRIQSMRFDHSLVQRIYLAPGLGAIVIFPCTLQEVFIGRGEDLKTQISPNDRKTLFLNLKLNSSFPTNVIAKCTPEKNVFVFDVIPSKSLHQDLVEIRTSFGRPAYLGANSIQEVTRTKSLNRLIVKSPVLVQKGESK